MAESGTTRIEVSRDRAVASRSASRQMVRSPLAVRRFTRTAAAVGQAAKARPKPVRRAVVTRTASSEATRRPAGRTVEKRTVQRATTRRASTAGKATSGRSRTSTAAAGWRMRDRAMAAVVAYARSQVGKSYSSGADGPQSFDCSGFTMQAYRRAGLRLPHSSGAQAARAYQVSRSQARPGDLVVGPGHVGIYMGDGMMIDAGNRRVGVVFRPLYDGLHIERLTRY